MHVRRHVQSIDRFPPHRCSCLSVYRSTRYDAHLRLLRRQLAERNNAWQALLRYLPAEVNSSMTAVISGALEALDAGELMGTDASYRVC